MALFLNAFRLALSAIARNKTRSILTVLGILIGVMAVTIVSALANGASNKIGGELDSFAANALYINPQPTQSSGAKGKVTGRLTEGDAKAIAREAVSVSGVGIWLSTQAQVVFQDKNVLTTVIGTNRDYFPIRKFTIARGEMWLESDELLKTKVLIIGDTVSKNLFGTEDPIGRTVRVGRAPYRIIGLLESRGSSSFGDDQDDRILMPAGSYRARVAPTSPGRVDLLIAGATSEHTTDRAMRQITEILRQRHRIPEGRDEDFTVNSQAEQRQFQQGIFSTLSMLLIGCATISLLVGGIGVMNIMLVSVAERTREIGIRMSIGAREGDILTQFLVESVVLSSIGGVLGALLGVGASVGLGRAIAFPLTPSVSSVLIAAGTSAAIGLVFGLVPARRAAKLDPIEALRTD